MICVKSLSKGKTFFVSDEDYSIIYGKPWWVCSLDYPFTRINEKIVRLHVLIMGRAQNGNVIDHINGYPWDNRRENLRVCSQSENHQNRAAKKNGRVSYKGVNPTSGGSFFARIKIGGKPVSLGSYNTAEEAAAVYDYAAIKVFKGFARLNFCESDRRKIKPIRIISKLEKGGAYQPHPLLKELMK